LRDVIAVVFGVLMSVLLLTLLFAPGRHYRR
jgi:hypothetical protein